MKLRDLMIGFAFVVGWIALCRVDQGIIPFAMLSCVVWLVWWLKSATTPKETAVVAILLAGVFIACLILLDHFTHYGTNPGHRRARLCDIQFASF